jgi:hypothetical protein
MPDCLWTNVSKCDNPPHYYSHIRGIGIDLQVQEIHDQLMREGIAKHGGYEITTEGDSFQVAFTTCHAAMAFCLDIQYRLLEQPWPKQVLALNACKMIRGKPHEPR